MWTTNILPSIMTRLKVEGNKALKTSYPDINFTDDIKSPTNPKFPTVLAIELPNTEQGQDLSNTTINALLYGMQIEVTDNEKQANVRAVMNEVLKIMKSMRFSVIGTPEITYTNGVYRSVARFRRMIASGDKL